MTTNSLAFRLFATAVAWTLLALPIAGAIIYSLYAQEVATSFDRRLTVLLTVVLSDTIDHGDQEPGDPKDVGEPLFEVTHSGWYWQIKPLDGRPGREIKSRSLADMSIPLPSENNVEPNEREVRIASLDGPLEQRLSGWIMRRFSTRCMRFTLVRTAAKTLACRMILLRGRGLAQPVASR